MEIPDDEDPEEKEVLDWEAARSLAPPAAAPAAKERQERALRILEVMSGLAVTAGLVSSVPPGRLSLVIGGKTEGKEGKGETPHAAKMRLLFEELTEHVFHCVREGGEAGVSQEAVGRKLGIGRRPLRRAIRGLIRAGRIEVIGKTRTQRVRVVP